MGTGKLEPLSVSREKLPVLNPNSNSFKFEIWAIRVRRQMLAALESHLTPSCKINSGINIKQLDRGEKRFCAF